MTPAQLWTYSCSATMGSSIPKLAEERDGSSIIKEPTSQGPPRQVIRLGGLNLWQQAHMYNGLTRWWAKAAASPSNPPPFMSSATPMVDVLVVEPAEDIPTVSRLVGFFALPPLQSSDLPW